MSFDSVILLPATTAAPGVGQPCVVLKPTNRTFHALGKTTAGTGTASVDILGANTGEITDAVLLGNIALTLGTVRVGDGFVSTAPWMTVWARVNTITGTGATVGVVAAS